MIRFQDRVVTERAGGCTVHALRTAASEIVTFHGSFRSCPDLRSNEDLLQSLCVSMLEKGTSRRSKVEIAEALENLGADIHFVSDDLRVGFQGKCLSRDVAAVVDLLAEQLREPALESAEFDLVRVQAIAAARQSMDRTSEQAKASLRRALFDEAHPNYGISPAKTISFYEAATCDQVRQYHTEHFGARDLNLVFVGDVDTAVVGDAVRGALATWTDHGEADSFSDVSTEIPTAASFVEIEGKPNSDVAIGHRLGLRRDHPDFIPLYVANYILGGNFSARLMTRIRDQLGLTYGIRSSLNGVTVEYGGYWETSVTLSSENVEKGTRETLRELEEFIDGGVSAEELADKKTTITGSFAVGLATTGGLADGLLANIERGFGSGYLDRFPQEVNGVTLEEVNGAIAKHLHHGRLHVATAGSVRPD